MSGGVTVAMITFNGERYLRDQIESILAQTPPPDELVIGDDGSSDATGQLIRELARGSAVPIRLVGEDHVGLRRNMQRTLEACTGDVVVLSDQDDVWLPGKIAAIQQAFLRPEVTLWFSDADLIDASGRLLGERLWERVHLPPGQQATIAAGRGLLRLLRGETVTGATMAFRSTLRELVLPLPDELDGDDHVYLHDGWIAVLSSLMGRSVLDTEARVLYRRHPRQVTAASEPGSTDELAEGGGLATKGELTRERDRISLVLDRLRERNALAACRPEDAATLVELESFLTARTLPRGAARVGAILREFGRRRYSRYARGWRTAGADLLLRRG